MSSSNKHRKDKERSDDYPRKEPQRGQPMLDEFFLDGDGIDREVLQSSICRFLGPEATCKPLEHKGRRGFKIRAIRTFTPAMLQDLKERSAEFSREAQLKRQRGGGAETLRYEDSQTRQRRDDPGPDVQMSYEPGYSSGPQYSQGPSGMPYNQGINPPGYPLQYQPDPSMDYNRTVHQPNLYSQPYTTYPPMSGNIPAYADPNRYASDYQYGGVRDTPPGQYGTYPPTYGDPRNPNYAPYPGYGDPSRGAPPGSMQSYTMPNEPPRMLDDPNSPYGRDPRMPNPSGDPRYPPHGGAGPAPYGENPRDPRDRDPRDPRDVRETRDPRDNRDYNARPSSDYPPPSRRR